MFGHGIVLESVAAGIAVVARERNVATRSCVVCRDKGEKRELIRFVSEQGKSGKQAWRADPAAVLPGRGLYCHPAERCLRSRKLEKAFPGLDGPLEALLQAAPGGTGGRLGANAFTYRTAGSADVRGFAAIVLVLRDMSAAVGSLQRTGPRTAGRSKERDAPRKKRIRL